MSAGHTANLFIPGESLIHRMAPEAKLVSAIGFVVAVALTPRRSVWSFAVDAALVLALLAIAGFRPLQVVTRLVVVLPFIAFAFLIPFVAGGEKTQVLGLALSTEGLWGTWNILAKALLGTTTSMILAGTTAIAAILRGLNRLRVPTVITSIMAFMFRYLDLIVGEMGRMRTAMVARGHDPRWLWQAKPIASSAGAMFVRSYERGERVHAAMTARGYAGTMPELDARRASGRDWILAAIPPLIAASAAIAGALLT